METNLKDFPSLLNRLAAKYEVNFAQLHTDTLGLSTVELASDLAGHMRWTTLISLRKTVRRCAELVG